MASLGLLLLFALLVVALATLPIYVTRLPVGWRRDHSEDGSTERRSEA